MLLDPEVLSARHALRDSPQDAVGPEILENMPVQNRQIAMTDVPKEMGRFLPPEPPDISYQPFSKLRAGMSVREGRLDLGILVPGLSEPNRLRVVKSDVVISVSQNRFNPRQLRWKSCRTKRVDSASGVHRA